MKYLHFVVLLSFLLAACQSQADTSTATALANTPVAAKPTAVKSTSAPAATPTPTGPALHTGGSPDAPNYIAVKDQAVVNQSLTFDTVVSAQAGFIVLYFDKFKNGKHSLGGKIVFAAVPAGKSSPLVIPLTQNINPTLAGSKLVGVTVDAVLQTDASNPQTMIENNNHLVMATFTILAPGEAGSSIFATPTP